MGKRVQGYMVDVRLFVQVDPRSLSDTTAKAGAVQAAMDGHNLTKMDGAKLVSIEQRYTSTDGEKIAALPAARLFPHTPSMVEREPTVIPAEQGVMVNANGDELDEEGAPIPRTPETGEDEPQEQTSRRRPKAA